MFNLEAPAYPTEITDQSFIVRAVKEWSQFVPVPLEFGVPIIAFLLQSQA